MQGLYSLQHLIGMGVGLHRMPDLAHNAILVDQKGRAIDAHERFAIHAFLFIDIVQLGNAGIGIGEQGKGCEE